MQSRTLIDLAMTKFERETEQRIALAPVDAWPATERTESKRSKRVAVACKDFWEFDAIYFAPEMYGDGHSASPRSHNAIVKIAQTPGVHIVAGARSHGKTVVGKKLAAWLLLAGRVPFIGTLSHTLPTSCNILGDVAALIAENARIMEDFGVVWGQRNQEQFQFRCTHTTRCPAGQGWRYAMAFSEGRSVRGATRGFGRPGFILGDDIETRVSPLSDDAVRERIWFVRESHKSLTHSGTLLWMANNFDQRCAVNKLLTEQRDGILPSHWRVHVMPAWDGKRPQWPARYPAKTETELMALLHVVDEGEWRGEYQQDPIPPAGEVFRREHYQEWKVLPDDAKGVVYADQNLALKGKGDTSALVQLLYSPSMGCFYVGAARCRSYNNPTKLFDDLFSLWSPQVFRFGMDGHVNQEGHWKTHRDGYRRPGDNALPHVEFYRFSVDECATNLQARYADKRLYFPPEFASTAEGKEFLNQFFAFTSKKAKRKDDAPDALICAHELLIHSGFVKPRPKQATNGETAGGRVWTVSITTKGRY